MHVCKEGIKFRKQEISFFLREDKSLKNSNDGQNYGMSQIVTTEEGEIKYHLSSISPTNSDFLDKDYRKRGMYHCML
jgi:hypothetical protein